MSESDNKQTDNTDAKNVTNDQNPDSLPDWARKAISEANGEAAKYRVKANSIADETRAAVTAEFNDQLKTITDEKSAVTSERDSAVTNYDKLVVALQAGIPGDSAVEFAGLLQGSNTDEYKAHAEKLKTMFGAPVRNRAVDPSHGASNNGTSDPADAFQALITGRLSR